MGCRPSRQSLGRVGDSTWSYNKSYMPEIDRVKQKNKRSGRNGRRKVPTYSAFSSTSKTYFDRDSKTSKITVRLSTDGSTLEIERYDIDLGDASEQDNLAASSESQSTQLGLQIPHESPRDICSLQKSASAPELLKSFNDPEVRVCPEERNEETRRFIVNCAQQRSGRKGHKELPPKRPHSLIVDPNIQIDPHFHNMCSDLPVLQQPVQLPAINLSQHNNMYRKIHCNCENSCYENGAVFNNDGCIRSYRCTNGTSLLCGPQRMYPNQNINQNNINSLKCCYNTSDQVESDRQKYDFSNGQELPQPSCHGSANKVNNSICEANKRVNCCFCLSLEKSQTAGPLYCPVPVTYGVTRTPQGAATEPRYSLCNKSDIGSFQNCVGYEMQTSDLFTGNKIDTMNGSVLCKGIRSSETKYDTCNPRCVNGTNGTVELVYTGNAYDIRPQINDPEQTRHLAKDTVLEKQTKKAFTNGTVLIPLVMNEQPLRSIASFAEDCHSTRIGRYDNQTDGVDCVFSGANIDSVSRLLTSTGPFGDKAIIHSEDVNGVDDYDDDGEVDGDDDDDEDDDDGEIDDEDEEEYGGEYIVKSDDFHEELQFYDHEYDIFDYIDDDIYLDARVCQTHVFDHVHRSPGAYRLGGTNSAEDDDDDESNIYDDDEVDENDDGEMGDEDSDTDEDKNDIYIDAVESTYV